MATQPEPQGISRDNYDAAWLEPGSVDPQYTKFTHVPMQEKAGSRDEVQPALAAAILDHHIHQRRVAATIERLGFPKAATLLASMLPNAHNTRAGNFGEVVASENLNQRHGYTMPVLKLRYMDHPTCPMRGEDVVAFRIEDDRITHLCVCEVKTLASFDRRQVDDAHGRLQLAYRPRPVSLSFISSILWNRNQDGLAAEVDRLIETLGSQSFPRDNWIFLITGNRPRSPFAVVEASEDVVPELSCVNLYLDGLGALVDEVFENPLSGNENDD